MVVAGDVSSFDAAGFRTRLLATFPSAVDATLTVEAASVRVHVELTMASAAEARSTADALTAADTATLSSSLGFTIEAIAPPTVSILAAGSAAPPPPPAATAAPSGALLTSGDEEGTARSSTLLLVLIAAAIVAAVAVSALVVILLRRRKAGGRGGWAPRRARTRPSLDPERAKGQSSTTTSSGGLECASRSTAGGAAASAAAAREASPSVSARTSGLSGPLSYEGSAHASAHASARSSAHSSDAAWCNGPLSVSNWNGQQPAAATATAATAASAAGALDGAGGEPARSANDVPSFDFGSLRSYCPPASQWAASTTAPDGTTEQLSWDDPNSPGGAAAVGGARLRAASRADAVKPIPWSELRLREPPIGSGTFGQVWMCSHAASEYAVKRLRPEVFLGNQPAAALHEALLQEYEIMRSLRHPNLLLLVGIATDCAQNTGIVSELMQASLLDVLNDDTLHSRVTWGGCLHAIAIDVAKGMAFLHYNAFLHRDLKPANVLLSEHWVAKIADFGASFDLSTASTTSAVHGTPHYMAPEMIRRQDHGKPADVWSYGCVLAHMGARVPPFAQLGAGGAAEIVMSAVVRGETTPLDLLMPANTPPPLLALARQCVSVDPAARPDFLTVAERLIEAEMLDAVRPTGGDSRPSQRLRRQRPGGQRHDDPQSYRLKFRQRSGAASPSCAASSPRSPRPSPRLDASPRLPSTSESSGESSLPVKPPLAAAAATNPFMPTSTDTGEYV